MTETVCLPGEFSRSEKTPVWKPSGRTPDLPISGGLAWHSGSPSTSLEVTFEEQEGELRRVHLIGVFATDSHATRGTVGAIIQAFCGEQLAYQHELVSGRHYGDDEIHSNGAKYIGDGSSIELLDSIKVEGRDRPIAMLTLDLPSLKGVTRIRFRSMGTPVSFLIYDVILERQAPTGCPFRGNTGNVALSEVGSIVRLGDRARFNKAVRQLVQGVRACEDDLDEAKSLALTFLAVVSAALLESGAPRSLHRLQLRAIRLFDTQRTSDGIAQQAQELVEEITQNILVPTQGQLDPLMERTFALLARNFSKDLTDADVAKQFGLSTSHFRHLFREASGKPFHKYLVAMRLERARTLILQENAAIGEIATGVGFSNAAHFSRIFQKHFGTTPSALRARRRN